MPAPCSCMGTLLSLPACMRAWDPRCAGLALGPRGQLRAGASCGLQARSRQGAGLTPLSGEQFKNCWKASTEEKKKKVSVKTCLDKRASLAQRLGWAAPLSAMVLTPCQAGRHRQGSRAELAVGRAVAVQLPAGGWGRGACRLAWLCHRLQVLSGSQHLPSSNGARPFQRACIPGAPAHPAYTQA